LCWKLCTERTELAYGSAYFLVDQNNPAAKAEWSVKSKYLEKPVFEARNAMMGAHANEIIQAEGILAQYGAGDINNYFNEAKFRYELTAKGSEVGRPWHVTNAFPGN